jgi:hypothetical protein
MFSLFPNLFLNWIQLLSSDGNDYELTVEVEEEYSNNIYSFYKINDISVVIDYKQNVNNCNNSIVDCSDESHHTCITVNTSHSSDITVNRLVTSLESLTDLLTVISL